MKKTLIATAVSAALMAPVAAQAEADVSLYGRIHHGIWLNSTDGSDSATDFASGGSRFGIKASSDLGNGMTASAHYEFGTNSDSSEDDSGVAATRIGTVGVSGGFGSITLGNQWGAYYNNVPYLDPTFESIGVLYWQKRSGLGSKYRTAKTIKYSNSFGPVSLELDARPVDSDPSNQYRDGFAVGATFAVNDAISISGAIDDGNDERLTALQGKVSLGNYSLAIVRHSRNPDGNGVEPSVTQFWGGGSWGDTSFQVGLGNADMDSGDATPGNDPSGITVGVYRNMGGGLTLMYEGGKLDNDGDGADVTDHWLGVKYDF